MTTRILVLSYYFPPDLSASRAQALVNALLAHDEVEIDVVTTRPNRYRSYRPGDDHTPCPPALSVTRVGLPPWSCGLLGQALGFAHYAFGVHRAIRGKPYDVIVATSSRLMTAALAASITRKTQVPLYLDIRDIFVDVLPELFPGRLGKVLAGLFRRVEALTLQRAAHVNLVSPGFLDYFSTRYPHKTFSTHTNGVDELFRQPVCSAGTTNAPNAPLNIVYAGNIGVGQGLEKILPQLAERLAGKACFYVIGDGNTRNKLRQALKRRQVYNVELIPPMPRERLIHYYQRADVLFLHLNDFKAFLKVIPSKLFEYAATGKPILAGLDGYAKAFTLHCISNASVFAPTNPDAAVAALAKLSLTATDRSAFIHDYARASIQQRMAIDILKTGNPK
ncbi:glycosyltransferase WbuB [Pseudomonas kairouanensis]|uniref:Glycosyltransferase WbuB n=1 Tax=Pseudomonas kairouanensis TaxID=2293832 RepID=A0A4Z0AY20_9PSED|nr:glycosyltransferase family 4 protein [Pseudomonas kairouanensis]TFY90818.1 glycosyltransferase WbuB [Pseudomonas kairouanensis]